MKKILTLLFVFCGLLLAGQTMAQAKKPEDKSKRPSPPATVTGPNFTIEYSRPSLKGRKAFGGLEPYGKVWRTGANEATTFTTTKDVKVNGQALAAGTYALFTIPGEQEWTIIFNKTAKQWGAYEYKQADDALRVQAKPTKTAAPVEVFTIAADKAGVVTLMWDNTQVTFTVK
ncbi:DUF2911 domain-containing protein [Hymenobacter sp. BT190]|uniref:DUF2911 domain-containing protein n=1 Tax=Hymenobacter sp. BT190 TaxID=2763505 RepID=UPI0016513DA7|nr:DUF2911 domain-containing protein [Hymenobacter sp. BT190]MBC6699344.1 DUF2911 domain-containing protein [Hymenobacter sp. BT190]